MKWERKENKTANKLKLQRWGNGKKQYFSSMRHLKGAMPAVPKWKESRIQSFFHSFSCTPSGAGTSKLPFSPSEGQTATGEPSGFVLAWVDGHARGWLTTPWRFMPLTLKNPKDKDSRAVLGLLPGSHTLATALQSRSRVWPYSSEEQGNIFPHESHSFLNLPSLCVCAVTYEICLTLLLRATNTFTAR